MSISEAQERVDQVPQKTLVNLTRVDKMPSDLRGCVHEFGLPIVDVFTQVGIDDPAQIRQMVHQVWTGTRETWKQKAKGYSGLVNKLDWLLAQNGAQINAVTLLRVLNDNNYTVVPRAPWACMVNASMEETKRHGLLDKRTKHHVRLIAAIDAAVKYAWPHLAKD